MDQRQSLTLALIHCILQTLPRPLERLVLRLSGQLLNEFPPLTETNRKKKRIFVRSFKLSQADVSGCKLWVLLQSLPQSLVNWHLSKFYSKTWWLQRVWVMVWCVNALNIASVDGESSTSMKCGWTLLNPISIVHCCIFIGLQHDNNDVSLCVRVYVGMCMCLHIPSPICPNTESLHERSLKIMGFSSIG